MRSKQFVVQFFVVATAMIAAAVFLLIQQEPGTAPLQRGQPTVVMSVQGSSAILKGAQPVAPPMIRIEGRTRVVREGISDLPPGYDTSLYFRSPPELPPLRLSE